MPNISHIEIDILNCLKIKPMYGFELVKDSGGNIKLGSVYTTLRRMEDKGLINSFAEENRYGEKSKRKPKRWYTITSDGVQYLSILTSMIDYI